jgi:pimeloyl-ACP methyl ester carboxylesterase
MRRFTTFLFISVAAAVVVSASSGWAADKIGIVLMHGKQGEPNGNINRLASDLDGAGYLVVRPEMCWAKTRIYDRTYADCLGEIDAAIAKLKSQGAGRIVVAGQSMGGAAAIIYGATHPGLAGVIALAPAHNPQRTVQNVPEVAASLAKANDMVAKGKGDEKADFTDVNTGPNGRYLFSVATSAKIYASIYGDDAPRLPAMTAKLAVPLLWIAGTDDPTQKGGPGFAFDNAPANPLNRYVSVNASHLETPDAGRTAVLAWLKELAAK